LLPGQTAQRSSVHETGGTPALRGAVIYRKLSLGSQCQAGEQRTARLLSAHTTCRLQRRSLHAYLIDVLTANAAGQPAPLPA